MGEVLLVFSDGIWSDPDPVVVIDVVLMVAVVIGSGGDDVSLFGITSVDVVELVKAGRDPPPLVITPGGNTGLWNNPGINN